MINKSAIGRRGFKLPTLAFGLFLLLVTAFQKTSECLEVAGGSAPVKAGGLQQLGALSDLTLCLSSHWMASRATFFKGAHGLDDLLKDRLEQNLNFLPDATSMDGGTARNYV